MAERSHVRFHPLVWPLWLVAGGLAAGSNPLHNLLILLGAALVAVTCGNDSRVAPAFGLFVRIGLVVIVLRVILSTVAVGGFAYGQTHLGRLPAVRLPWWIGGLELGGPFTLEMLVTALTGGLQLLTLLALFGAFNAVADHYGLLRRTPGFLGGAGLAVTIALAFVPQTLHQLVAIREAQRVRGHRFRGWRDTLPLLVPLISGGLERSLQLAEAMDSRGYGARTRGTPRAMMLEQLTTVAGLAMASIGLFLIFYQPRPWLGLALLAGASAILLLVAHSLGRSTHRTRYIRERWRMRDTFAAMSSFLLLLAVPLVRAYTPDTLVYTPLPRAELPPFGPLSIVLALLLIAPAAVTLAVEWRGRRPAVERLAGVER